VKLGFGSGLSFVPCTSNVSHPSQTNGSNRAMRVNWVVATSSDPLAHVGARAVPSGLGQIRR
jgi:hypothetical protein